MGFDANLPGLERCKPDCESDKNTLCIHGFHHKVQTEHYDSKRFSGWSDIRVFTHFLGHILFSIAKGTVIPDDCVFIILTKDRNFIDDVKKEWEEKKAETYLPLVFSGNFISCGGLVVFIQQIDCPSCGHKRADDLKCAFNKVNDFFTKNQRA